MAIREEFFTTRQGKRFVLFAGLLDEAHQQGLGSIETELQREPSEENGNTAIVKARVTMEDGHFFEGIGDASPQNVGRNIAPHIIRMAETRAKARALRDAVNVAVAALEELHEEEDRPAPVKDIRDHQKQAQKATEASPPTTQQKRDLRDVAQQLYGEKWIDIVEERLKGKHLADLTGKGIDNLIAALHVDLQGTSSEEG
jgi:hypothetical protein